ncbi:MAG: 3'(2'),5'-bisphosphate nucleotidase CysQ [Microbacterium sp.]|nr:3'(2'),5'-bisphosphate nucleotidase CysQ [Microbacterium sp.]
MTAHATSDAEFARFLAEGAGAVLTGLRAEIGDAEYEPKALKDAGDAASQAWLARQLAEHRPDDAVLSEEAKDTTERLDADRVWIIDPLDGTREFSERENGVWRTDWAVHIALWTREANGLALGVVALPARDAVYSSATVGTVDDQRVAGILDGSIAPRIAVSRTRPPAIVTTMASQHDLEFVPMGSAGVKVISVVTGEVDIYLHGGGQYEWDSAAPVAVAAAAGLFTSRLDGSDLVYNSGNPWLPDLVVCPPALRPALGDWIAEAAATVG